MESRQRAPSCSRDLDPEMRCPAAVEVDRLESESSSVLGLCGPSELRDLSRARRRLPQAPRAASALSLSAAISVEEVLRRRLRCLDKAGCSTLLWPSVGRRDVTQHIMSFVEAERPLMDTEVGGKMFQDTGSANLDLFFQAVPQSKPELNLQLQGLLAKAWAESPEVCLKQVFQLGWRDGKQDRYSFYDAMLWLWYKDPATLLANLHLVPECNYWKGLLEVLARVCEGPSRSLQRDLALYSHYKRCHGTSGKYKMNDAGLEGDGNFRPGSRLQLAREALKRYDRDPVYRALFEHVARLFAEQLRADLAAMRRGRRVSLCAKWCPLLYHSFDRRTLLCEGIARWLFPPSLPEFAGCTERQYAYRARDQLRRRLSELGEYMQLPERLMCQQRWGEIRYKALPAACLTKHIKSFEKHDPVRFREFMDQVEGRKVRVNTGALQPHEILRRASRVSCGADLEKGLAQAQWRAMLERARAAGQLQDCVAVCDVSGSMSCEAAPGVSCMDVAISMSLLVAELAPGPLARRVITFHENPALVELPDTQDLAELAAFLRRLPWGGSTNFHRVFDLLATRPPKKVIVFSDMQFASAGGNLPVLRHVQETYRQAGLRMPELVFWNLRGATGAPALATDAGVVLMSGFSSRMLKMVTEFGDPLATFSKALDNPLCAKVRVIHAGEAEELLAGPRPPVHLFAEEPEEPELAQEIAPCRAQRRPPRAVRAVLAVLPCREAAAALIGKRGRSIRDLRQALHGRLCEELDAGRFRFWLDVIGQTLTATVEAAESSFEEEQLRSALETLKRRVPRSVIYNKVRHALTIDGDELPEPELSASAVLAEVPGPVAVLIGRGGKNIRILEAELVRLLDAELGPGRFRFSLDVQSVGTTGVVTGTLEALVACEGQGSLTARQLQTALHVLKMQALRSPHISRVLPVKVEADRSQGSEITLMKDDRGDAARLRTRLAGVKRARAQAAARAEKERELFKFIRAARAKAVQVSRRSGAKMMSRKMQTARTGKLFAGCLFNPQSLENNFAPCP